MTSVNRIDEISKTNDIKRIFDLSEKIKRYSTDKKTASEFYV
jgi:hypothetical protein